MSSKDFLGGKASNMPATGRRSYEHLCFSQRSGRDFQTAGKTEPIQKSQSPGGMSDKMDTETTLAGKSMQDSNRTDAALTRLRGIKLQSLTYSQGGSQSSLMDERISMDEFSNSVRVLDAACGSQPPLKIQKDPACKSGLVPFSVFQRETSDDYEETDDRRHSVTHLSFDEDNEEDMFAETKDDAMETGDTDRSNVEEEKTSSFLGFSSQESIQSRDVATKCCELGELAKLDSDEPKERVFRGFTSAEQDWSSDAMKISYRLVNDYERHCVTDLRPNGREGKCTDRTNTASDLLRRRQLRSMELPKGNDKKQTNPNCTLPLRSRSPRESGIEDLSLESRRIASPLNSGASKLDSTDFCGFSTASGHKIVLSQAAISRARKLYEQVELDVENETKIHMGKRSSQEELEAPKKQSSKESLFDESEDEIIGRLIEPNHIEKSNPEKKSESVAIEQYIPSGFTTASGEQLKVPRQALSQAQAQFDDIQIHLEEKAKEMKVESVEKVTKNNVGFKTAGGREINISKEALSKARAQFDEIASQLSECSTPTSSQEGKEEKISSGFKTAGGGQIKVSKNAISKARAHFDEMSDELDRTLTPNDSRSVINEKVSRTGFTTAAGRELKISKEALSKAEAEFQELENEFVKNMSQKSSKLNTPSTDDPTATGKRVRKVEAHASPLKKIHSVVDASNFESLEFEDFLKDENDESARKRKFEDVDEDTPMRRDPAWKRKKGRYISELQGRKLFDEDPVIIGQPNSTIQIETPCMISDPEKNHTSDEISASAAALLEDEERRQRIPKATSPCITDDFDIEMEIEDHEEKTKNLQSSFNPNLVSLKIPATNFRCERNKNAEITGESIPDDLTFDSQFSGDQNHSQVINKFIAETMKIMEARLAMTSKQDETIRAKRRCKPQASDGSLYQLRISNKDKRLSWRKLTEGKPPVPRDNFGATVDSEVLTITANSAVSYTFCCADFYGGSDVRINVEGIKVGDGAFLILDERNCAGVREFERAFLGSPGVDPNLVPAGWVKNHYRWIVWKLASMDRVKFGQKCLPRMLTPNRVMLELKYRYDREIYRTQWPPLKRILEKNEDAGARLVLCVASIVLEDEKNKTPAAASSNSPSTVSSQKYKMRLTDGWYDIPATIDQAMVNCIKSGKIREGTKIVTFGAKAMNLDQGCSVLEIPECVTLRIHTNSTRRARWDEKLNFCRLTRAPMSLSLKSVKSNGGAICKLVVAVARSYPILYREKLPDGQFVFRNARCDEEAARAHEARCQAKMEEICEKVQAEFQFDLGSGDGQEEEIRRAIATKLKECLPPPRDVTPVLKIRLAEGDTSAMMTIWSTGRETDDVFEEGSSLSIYNCFAAGQRCNELQITAGRNTLINRESSRRINYPERVYTSLMDIAEIGFNPVYSEFDTVGIVSSIGPAPHGMKNFETVNLAGPRSDSTETSDFLSILFWQGVSTHGYSKILTVGALVACSNLEWRRNTSRSLPTAYCTERSLFTKNPRQKHLAKPFESLRELVKDPFTYAANCGTQIQEEVAKKTPLRTPGSGTFCRATTNATTPGWSPRDPLSSSIDTNSTPKNNSRKASIMRRIEKLEAYGEAPKLPSISLNHSSPKVLSEFRSPVVTPVTKS